MTIFRRSRGQALVWLTLMLPVFLSVAGLALDGGVLLMTHHQLQSIADGAARAGATRLDVDRLRSSGGVDVELDQAVARDVAVAYIDAILREQRTPVDDVTASTAISSRRVHVTLQGSVRTAFLRIAHIDSVPLLIGAEADVQYGIRDGQGG